MPTLDDLLQQRPPKNLDNLLAQEPPAEPFAIQEPFDPAEAPSMAPEPTLFSQTIGTQAKGWMKVASAIVKMPKHTAGLLKSLDPEGVSRFNAQMDIDIASEDEKIKVDPTYKPPYWYRSSKRAKKQSKAYNQILDDHARGMQAIIKSHPEWKSEPPKGFIDLATSPRKLFLAVAEAVPLLVAAGVTTAAGRPDVAFALMYASEGQEAYDMAITDGATPEQAEATYHIYGSVAAVLETLQLGGIMKGFSKARKAMLLNRTVIKVAGKSITKQAIKLAAKEAAEEMAQQGWQEITAKMVYGKDPEGGWRGVFDRQLSAGLVGGVMGLIPGLGGSVTGGTQVFAQEQLARATEKELTPERWLEIKEGRGAEPTNRESTLFLGRPEPGTGALFESEKIKAQLAEGPGRPLITQEQGKRAFTLEEAVEPSAPKKAPVRAVKPPEEPTEAVSKKPKAGTIADRKAKQAAIEAKKAPKVVRKELPSEKPTQKQFAQGHILAKQRGLSDDAYREFAQKITGKSSMADMTPDEASKFIASMQKPKPIVAKPAIKFTVKEKAQVMKSAKDSGTFNTVMAYANKLGPAPVDPTLRKAYIKDLRAVALIQKRLKKKLISKDIRRDEVNVINQWSSARYALGQAEVKSGVPLRSKYSKIASNATASRIESNDIMRKALKDSGVGAWSAAMSKNENNLMASWLFAEKAKQKNIHWNQMKPKTKKIAKEIKGVLQGRAANEVREARWRLWDAFEKKVIVQRDKLKGQEQTKMVARKLIALESALDETKPPNAPEKALAGGRKAHSEGKLKEWIASQTWGTRQEYYMSEAALDNLIDMASELKVPSTIEDLAAIGPAPATFLREARTREGAARVKGGSVVNATSSHLERLMIFNSTYDTVQDLWESYKEASPSAGDIQTLRNFIDTALGKGKERNAFVKALQKTTRAFWRFHFFSPVKSAWFVTRNLVQNIAYAPSQMSIVEWAKSTPTTWGKKALGKKNPEMAEAFKNEWKSKISQKRQMYRQFLLQEEGAIAGKLGQRAVITMDVAGSLATMSDEINRMTVWPVLYSSAQRNAKLYKSGKISYGTLSSRLRLDTLHVTQRIEMKQLLENNPKEFQAKFAEYKTENIHFKYETAFRAAVEQNPLSRIALGLTVYPRGFYELAYQNSVKPLFQGMRTGNYRQAWQGLLGLLFLYVGADVARRIIEKITGKTAYGFLQNLTQYRPLGPGFGKIKDLMDDWSGIRYRGEQNGWTPQRTAEQLVSAASASLEMFIPFSDVMINIYETNNNVYGVRLYRLAKKMAMDEYGKKHGTKFRTTDRDMWEKIQHIVFGGAEKPTTKKSGASFSRVE